MKVEHKWNVLLLASLSIFSISQINAEFVIIKPLERGQGGSLVDGTISFKHQATTQMAMVITKHQPIPLMKIHQHNQKKYGQLQHLYMANGVSMKLYMDVTGHHQQTQNQPDMVILDRTHF